MKIDSYEGHRTYPGMTLVTTADFTSEDKTCKGWVVSYPNAEPPYARVLFAWPHHPEYVETYENERMPDYTTPWAVAALVNKAVELEPINL